MCSFVKPYVCLLQNPEDEQTTTTTVITKSLLKPRINARNFTPLELKQLYNWPQPGSARFSIVVPSFGGGLFGTRNAQTGVLTNGDVQTYWSQLGIVNQPTVKISFVGNATNNPQSNDGATMENTLDVEMIGACYPNCDITLLIAPNTMQGFLQCFQTALALNPFGISCSWGLPEKSAPNVFLNSVNSVLQQCATNGINVTCAAGDNGSSDGIAGANADFPGSSPNVVCCGGTTLLSNTNTYDNKTQETVWNNNTTSSATGGGKSVVFAKPAYQNNISNITGNFRAVPDIAMVANPNTGVIFYINGSQVAVGGTSVTSPFMMGYLMTIGCNIFVNPLLYMAPATCFHDIITGTNGAYKATKGYDMCSGLGSINGTLLKASITTNLVTIRPTTLQFTTLATSQQLTLYVGNVAQNAKTAAKTKVVVTGTWSSSNVQVATVNATTGLVTSVANGTCNIVFSALPNNPVICVVQTPAILPTAIVCMPQIRIGASMQLATKFTPANTTNKSATWLSLQPEIATVDSSTGVVTGVAEGVALIRGTTTQGGRTLTSTLSVMVIP